MCLHYMMDIETHTVIYLRDLLATRAAHDPYVTGFLSCWVYEELWHGEAFSDFLRAYGLEVPAEPKLPDGSTPMPTRPNRVHEFREQMGVGHKLFLLPTLFASMAMRDFVALHMTWGAINELTTLTGYYQLMRRSSHPVLHQMLRRIIQDERRHFAFYRAQAKARLEDNRRARRLVRWGLKAFWTPVGAGVKTQEEVDALAIYLFGDSPEGRAGRARDRRHDRGDPRPRAAHADRGRPRGGARAGRGAAGVRGRRARRSRSRTTARRRWRPRWPPARPPARRRPSSRTSSPGLDHPAAHDVGAQAAAIHEALQHTGLGQLLQVAARVAQPPAHALRLAHREAAADQVVERDAACHDVAPRLRGRQLDPGVRAQAFDRLHLDQRDVAALAARVVRERAAVVEVPVALDPLARDCAARPRPRAGSASACGAM